MSEMRYDSTIFESLLNQKSENDISEDLKPQDITESIHLDLNDDFINKSKCSLIAYNIHVDETDDSEAYNPKTNPDKAIDILMESPGNNLKLEIYLDTPSLEWDSLINDKEKLSPEQMEGFFKTNFYNKLNKALNKIWPRSDKFFGNLLNAIQIKKYKIDWFKTKNIDEDSNVFDKNKINKEQSRKKNISGQQTHSRSGRKYISPSDFDVKHDENEKYYCWPDQKGRGEFKWSNWADYKKIKPVARIRFKLGQYVYGISFSCIVEDDKNRGAKSYNLDLEPKLQYLTPEETSMMMKLSIVQKFLRHSTQRISKYISMDDEEIFNKINRPDKCTIADIRKTKQVLRNTLRAIKEARHDTYIYV